MPRASWTKLMLAWAGAKLSRDAEALPSPRELVLVIAVVAGGPEGDADLNWISGLARAQDRRIGEVLARAADPA